MEKKWESIGCVEYGNNNIFEVVKRGDEIGFIDHDDPAGEEAVPESLEEFFADVPKHHLGDVLKQYTLLLRG